MSRRYSFVLSPGRTSTCPRPLHPQLYLRVTRQELVLDRLMAAESFFLSSLDDNYFVFQDTMLCILTIFLRDDSVAYYLGLVVRAGGNLALKSVAKPGDAAMERISAFPLSNGTKQVFCNPRLDPIPTSNGDEEDTGDVESNGR